MSNPQLVLGADFSTDSVKAIVYYVETGEEFGEPIKFNLMEVFGSKYGLQKGGYLCFDNGAVRIPYGLIADALDLLMQLVAETLGKNKANLAGICVSFQQHGMVAFSSDSFSILKNSVSPERSLSEQIGGMFTTEHATSWMDTSSRSVCEQLSQCMAPEEWARLTGSVPMQSLRFLCPQAARLYSESSDAFERTAQFTVLASLGAALLTGIIPGIGIDEASMTLGMHIQRGEWSDQVLTRYPLGLRQRLPNIVVAGSLAGTLSQYWVARYGFSPQTKVYLGFGDNIAANMTANNVISLGSSGTIHRRMEAFVPDLTGATHILRDGTGGYMAMFVTDVCAKFANFVREYFNLSWEEFDENVAKPCWKSPDSIIFKMGGDSDIHCGIQGPDAAAAVTRSILYNMYRGCAFIGTEFPHLVATGGFAKDPVIQVIADIWQKPVFLAKDTERVARGSAIWAMAQETGRSVDDVAQQLCPLGQKFEPEPARAPFYAAFGQQFDQHFPLQ